MAGAMPVSTAITLQDTLSGEIRRLAPLAPAQARIYSCSPTVAGLWQARTTRPGQLARWRAGGGRRIRKGRRPRLRAVERREAGRALVVDFNRRGTAGLAYRMLRHEHGPPRAFVRHPYGRRRPDLSPSRERDR